MLLMQVRILKLISKNFSIAVPREALDASLGNNAMKRGLIEQIAF